MLACTHYPLLKKLIQEELGTDVTIVDSALTCAQKVATELNHLGLTKENGRMFSPNYQYFVSDDPDKFSQLGAQFLGMPISNVELAVQPHLAR